MNTEKKIALQCAWDAHTPIAGVVQFCHNIGATVTREEAEAFYAERERAADALVDHDQEAAAVAKTMAEYERGKGEYITDATLKVNRDAD